jgi:hypothetical protein
MNTPTQEDIALAKEINRSPRHYSSIAHMIADHCAPLRELAEIGRLAVDRERCWERVGGHLEQLQHDDRIDRAVRDYLAKGAAK